MSETPRREPSRFALVMALGTTAAFCVRPIDHVPTTSPSTSSPAPAATPPPPARRAPSLGDLAAARARARTMGSDGHVAVLMGEGESAVVVHVSGCVVPRGTDLVRDVEVVPAPDAVALMRDGAWAIDARGHFFDVPDPGAGARCAERPCVPQEVPGHGRVVALTGYYHARLEDGTVARRTRAAGGWVVDEPDRRVVDLSEVELGDDIRRELLPNGDVRHVVTSTAINIETGRPDHPRREFVTSALRVADPVELVEDRLGDVACVRGGGGDLRCGALFDHAPGRESRELRWAPLDVPPTGTAQVAVSSRELCRVGADGGFACAQFLPQDDYGPVGAPPLRFSPVEGLDDVSEVALAWTAGCARRRSGEVLCWGPMFRHGGVVRRDVPVPVEGLDAVEGLAAFAGYVCALHRGAVSCWGGGLFRHGSSARPRPISNDADATGIAAAWNTLCVTRAGGGVRCWAGDPFETPPTTVRGTPPGALHDLQRVRGHHYHALDEQGTAWVADAEERPTFSFRRVAPPEGREPIAEGDHLVSAEPDIRALLPGAVRPRISDGDNVCLLSVAGRVACRWSNGYSYMQREAYCAGVRPVFTPTLVPGLDDAVELATNGGLTCARRAAGTVVCWGANVAGVLTVAESARAPRLHRLDEMLARTLAR